MASQKPLAFLAFTVIACFLGDDVIAAPAENVSPGGPVSSGPNNPTSQPAGPYGWPNMQAAGPYGGPNIPQPGQYMPQPGQYMSQPGPYMPQPGPYMIPPMQYPRPNGSQNAKAKPQQNSVSASHTLSALNGQAFNNMEFEFGK